MFNREIVTLYETEQLKRFILSVALVCFFLHALTRLLKGESMEKTMIFLSMAIAATSALNLLFNRYTFRLDCRSNMILQGRYLPFWKTLKSYPLSDFAAVAGEETDDAGFGRHGRLWLVGKTGRKDLMLDNHYYPLRRKIIRSLAREQTKIARLAGLPVLPLRAFDMSADVIAPACPEKLRPAKGAQSFRAPPQSRKETEFRIYSRAQLQFRMLLWLLLPTFFLLVGILSGSIVFTLVSLAMWFGIAAYLKNRLDTAAQVRYLPQQDRFIRLNPPRGISWQQGEQLAAAAFGGVYCRMSPLESGGWEIRLAAQAGGDDVLLMCFDSFFDTNNRRAAAKTAAQISRATGLPLLEYTET